MSLQDKINSAKPTTFLTDGLSEEEVKQAVDEGRRHMSDLISKQKVFDTLDFADNALTDEERTVEKYKELLTECIKALPSVQPEPISEEYAKAVRNWLVNYQVKCAELRGRYTPYEVLGWIVNDWRKENEIW